MKNKRKKRGGGLSDAGYACLWILGMLGVIGCGGGDPLSSNEALGEIVFAARPDSLTNLYTIDANGTKLRRITRGKYSYIMVRWSPDGRRLAVMSDKDRLNLEGLALHLMNADGSGMRLLTRPGGAPAWSPDNTRIALSKDTRFGGFGSPDIVIFNADGSNETQVTNTSFTEIVRDWSPDGTRLLIASDDPLDNPEGDMELYIIDLQGQRLRRLTDNDVGDFGARWSPDGTRIAYSAFDSTQGRRAIFLMNEDGTGKRRVQNAVNAFFIVSLAWSPTGDRIAFVSGDDRSGDLYTVKTDGTDLTMVVGGMSIGDIDWRR